MADKVFHQAFGQTSIHANGIPMFFVHVVPWEDRVGESFPKRQGPFWIAFGIESIRFHQISKHKNLAQSPEGKGIFVKRQVLGTVWEAKAKIAKAFEVHRGYGLRREGLYLCGLNIVYVFWNLLGTHCR